jgi:ribosomal-protein-alanine N-acetyltransferase
MLEELASGRLVGVTSLHRIDWARRCAGIGYWVRRSRARQGFATEGVEAVVGHAFASLSIHRLEALVALDNAPSQRVVEKLGFTREGVAREVELIEGRFLDHFQYSLLDSDAPRRLRGAA